MSSPPDLQAGPVEIDSALGDIDSIASSTTSMTSSILEYRLENGRTYHAYKEGKWFIPNDEGENDRLDHQHHLYCLTLEGALGLSPPNLKETTVHRVLDVGTGTGIWAMDFADEHPEADVLGVDLSPTQPAFVPPNLKFEVDDLEEPWTFNKKFEYIHSRMMTGAFANWPRFFEQSFENLEPGGWVETQDLSFPIGCDDSTLTPDHALKKWNDFMLEAATKFGRALDAPPMHAKMLEEAGFINVRAKKFMWPQNRWAKDKKANELGLWCQENFFHGVQGICLALFTRALNWTREEVELFLVSVRKDIKNLEIHAYWSMWVVYGQKPLLMTKKSE